MCLFVSSTIAEHVEFVDAPKTVHKQKQFPAETFPRFSYLLVQSLRPLLRNVVLFAGGKCRGARLGVKGAESITA